MTHTNRPSKGFVKTQSRGRKRGIVLIVAMLAVTLLTSMGVTYQTISSLSSKQTSTRVDYQNALAIAEAGVQKATLTLTAQTNIQGTAPNTIQGRFGGGTYTVQITSIPVQGSFLPSYQLISTGQIGQSRRALKVIVSSDLPSQVPLPGVGGNAQAALSLVGPDKKINFTVDPVQGGPEKVSLSPTLSSTSSTGATSPSPDNKEKCEDVWVPENGNGEQTSETSIDMSDVGGDMDGGCQTDSGETGTTQRSGGRSVCNTSLPSAGGQVLPKGKGSPIMPHGFGGGVHTAGLQNSTSSSTQHLVKKRVCHPIVSAPPPSPSSPIVVAPLNKREVEDKTADLDRKTPQGGCSTLSYYALAACPDPVCETRVCTGGSWTCQHFTSGDCAASKIKAYQQSQPYQKAAQQTLQQHDTQQKEYFHYFPKGGQHLLRLFGRFASTDGGGGGGALAPPKPRPAPAPRNQALEQAKQQAQEAAARLAQEHQEQLQQQQELQRQQKAQLEEARQRAQEAAQHQASLDRDQIEHKAEMPVPIQTNNTFHAVETVPTPKNEKEVTLNVPKQTVQISGIDQSGHCPNVPGLGIEDSAQYQQVVQQASLKFDQGKYTSDTFQGSSSMTVLSNKGQTYQPSIAPLKSPELSHAFLAHLTQSIENGVEKNILPKANRIVEGSEQHLRQDEVWGTPSYPEITVLDAQKFDLENNAHVEGQGILVIKGDFELKKGASLDFTGPVIVLSEKHNASLQNHSGNLKIQGPLIVATTQEGQATLRIDTENNGVGQELVNSNLLHTKETVSTSPPLTPKDLFAPQPLPTTEIDGAVMVVGGSSEASDSDKGKATITIKDGNTQIHGLLAVLGNKTEIDLRDREAEKADESCPVGNCDFGYEGSFDLEGAAVLATPNPDEEDLKAQKREARRGEVQAALKKAADLIRPRKSEGKEKDEEEKDKKGRSKRREGPEIKGQEAVQTSIQSETRKTQMSERLTQVHLGGNVTLRYHCDYVHQAIQQLMDLNQKLGTNPFEVHYSLRSYQEITPPQ